MRPPFSIFQFLLLAFSLLLVLTFIYLGVLSVAFEKLGLSLRSAMLLLVCTLLGSGINLPLFSIAAEQPTAETRLLLRRLYWGRLPPFTGKTVVAINVGGALIPICFSVYLMSVNHLPPLPLLLAIGVVAAVSLAASRPIPGLGIGMPVFVAPIVAALTATLTVPGQSAPSAYICGTLGVLIGADLLRMKDIRKIGTPIASIGGAGTFDGIFLTGIVAVLLA